MVLKRKEHLGESRVFKEDERINGRETFLVYTISMVLVTSLIKATTLPLIT